MTMAREPISAGQIRAIHAATAALGIDEETYRMMLRERFDVATCKALSRIQAGLLLDEMTAKRANGRTRRSAPTPRRHTWPEPARRANPGKTITEKQQRYLERLFYKLGWDQARRDGLCKKVIGKAWAQTNGDMDRLLRVLLPMTKRYPGGYDRARGDGA